MTLSSPDAEGTYGQLPGHQHWDSGDSALEGKVLADPTSPSDMSRCDGDTHHPWLLLVDQTRLQCTEDWTLCDTSSHWASGQGPLVLPAQVTDSGHS